MIDIFKIYTYVHTHYIIYVPLNTYLYHTQLMYMYDMYEKSRVHTTCMYVCGTHVCVHVHTDTHMVPVVHDIQHIRFIHVHTLHSVVKNQKKILKIVLYYTAVCRSAAMYLVARQTFVCCIRPLNTNTQTKVTRITSL